MENLEKLELHEVTVHKNGICYSYWKSWHLQQLNMPITFETFQFLTVGDSKPLLIKLEENRVIKFQILQMCYTTIKI